MHPHARAAGGAGHHRHDEFVECGTLRISGAAEEAGAVSVILASPFPHLLDADEDAFGRVLARCVSILNDRGRTPPRRPPGGAGGAEWTRFALPGGGVWELVAAGRLDAIARGGEDRRFAAVLRIFADSLRQMVVSLLINAGHDTRYPTGASTNGADAASGAHHGDSLGLVHRLQSMLGEGGDQAVDAVRRILRDAVDGGFGEAPAADACVYDDVETRLCGISNAVSALSIVSRSGITLTNCAGEL